MSLIFQFSIFIIKYSLFYKVKNTPHIYFPEGQIIFGHEKNVSVRESKSGRKSQMFNKKYKYISTRFICLVLVLLTAFTLCVGASGEVYLGGFPFGLKMDTEGVFVADVTDFDSTIGRVSPARDADVKAGDVILSVNGKKTDSVEEVSQLISDSKGKRLTLEIKRGGETFTRNLVPVLTRDKSGYKSGMWIKDATAGIGTVTYISEDKQSFGGLGHGICDRATLELLPLRDGTVHRAVINSVVKGNSDQPGELRGSVEEEASGTLLKNTEMGVFGKFGVLSQELKKITVADKDEIKTGKCIIYTCLDGEKPMGYEGEIVRILDKTAKTKNFIVKLTDPKALEKAGGIVQGMSGSPIVQNGKLVGAVTHVLMRDQTSGYGIFIENMLAEAEK
ncbi:MAG: SpoIVB peptidase [Clostridia bacterium]|nr:SpoIVB peptidase [Clostridia bacterium]